MKASVQDGGRKRERERHGRMSEATMEVRNSLESPPVSGTPIHGKERTGEERTECWGEGGGREGRLCASGSDK